jgi:hypothetical protein
MMVNISKSTRPILMRLHMKGGGGLYPAVNISPDIPKNQIFPSPNCLFFWVDLLIAESRLNSEVMPSDCRVPKSWQDEQPARGRSTHAGKALAWMRGQAKPVVLLPLSKGASVKRPIPAINVQKQNLLNFGI